MTTPVPFDEDFLGPTTPKPSRPGLIELPYMHFTVSMDPNRRLAAVTAVNIDGSRLRAVARGDNWRLDDRLPADQQAGPELYSNNDLDRGHLVRRRDPVWGPQEVAERANSDTFHYTVCAPQTSTLNQSMTLWLGLEDYVLEHARQYGQLLSVFTGCIFAGEDPIYRDVAIPRQFYKIAAWAQGEELAATGYVLDQTSSLDHSRCRSRTSRRQPLSSSPNWSRPTATHPLRRRPGPRIVGPSLPSSTRSSSDRGL